MLYAKLHTFNGDQQTIAVQAVKPDSSWKAFNVPDLTWLKIVDGVVVQAAPSIDGPRAAKLSEINAKCEQLLAQVRAKYPESEIMSWPKQEQEARAYLASPGHSCPLLQSLADSRGITIQLLADRVVAKADEYALVSGSIIGTRQRIEDQLDALESDATIEDIEGIQWPSE